MSIKRQTYSWRSAQTVWESPGPWWDNRGRRHAAVVARKERARESPHLCATSGLIIRAKQISPALSGFLKFLFPFPWSPCVLPGTIYNWRMQKHPPLASPLLWPYSVDFTVHRLDSVYLGQWCINVKLTVFLGHTMWSLWGVWLFHLFFKSAQCMFFPLAVTSG